MIFIYVKPGCSSHVFGTFFASVWHSRRPPNAQIVELDGNSPILAIRLACNGKCVPKMCVCMCVQALFTATTPSCSRIQNLMRNNINDNPFYRFSVFLYFPCDTLLVRILSQHSLLQYIDRYFPCLYQNTGTRQTARKAKVSNH